MPKINILFFTLLLWLFSACSENKDDNIWVVGTSADNPPYEFMMHGEVAGFDIDFFTEVAKHLGKKVDFRNMEFHGLLAALASDNIDFAVAGLSITPERAKRVDFSIPYAVAEISFLVRRSDNIARPEDLRNKIVGVQLGTTWSLLAQGLSVTNGFKVNLLTSNLLLVEDLKSGRVDAVIMENIQAQRFAQIYPGFSKFTIHDLNFSFAVAMPKNSPNKKDLDEAIKALRKNGVIEALSKKWGLIGAN